MKNLIASDEDAWAAFEAIRDEKHEPNKSILRALSPLLQDRYARYAEHRMNLEHIPDAPPFDEPQQEALASCYESRTKRRTQLLQRITQRQSAVARSKCQCCGIDSPGTWDHYLPQVEFREFSVHPDNLVPCCDRCNRYRGACWRKDGERVHINLYFDQIEVVERFLVARIVFDQDGEPFATFEVNCSRATNEAFARRYERHCGALNLLERFEQAAPKQLAQMARDVLRSAARLAGDVNEIARELREQAEDLRDLFGANNWEVALGVAAAQSREFIEYCLRPLPEHGEVST